LGRLHAAPLSTLSTKTFDKEIRLFSAAVKSKHVTLHAACIKYDVYALITGMPPGPNKGGRSTEDALDDLSVSPSVELTKSTFWRPNGRIVVFRGSVIGNFDMSRNNVIANPKITSSVNDGLESEQFAVIASIA